MNFILLFRDRSSDILSCFGILLVMMYVCISGSAKALCSIHISSSILIGSLFIISVDNLYSSISFRSLIVYGPIRKGEWSKIRP